MGSVVVDVSMSLDGFVTGPDPGLEQGLGAGGEALHTWALASGEADLAVVDATVASTGAVVMGRRLFDIVDGPHGWNDEMGYGGHRTPAHPLPFFVVTHRPPAATRLTGDFTFVTEGVAAAVERARARAGGRDVVLMGGADVCDQAVAAGVVDEIRLHLAPVLLGGGTRLFAALPSAPRELTITALTPSPHATHLTYRLPR